MAVCRSSKIKLNGWLHHPSHRPSPTCGPFLSLPLSSLGSVITVNTTQVPLATHPVLMPPPRAGPWPWAMPAYSLWSRVQTDCHRTSELLEILKAFSRYTQMVFMFSVPCKTSISIDDRTVTEVANVILKTGWKLSIFHSLIVITWRLCGTHLLFDEMDPRVNYGEFC